MKEENGDRIRELLKKTMIPVDPELKRDLWPQMLHRLEEQPVHVPWFDWALVALLAMWFFFFPEAIPVLLYHL